MAACPASHRPPDSAAPPTNGAAATAAPTGPAAAGTARNPAPVEAAEPAPAPVAGFAKGGGMAFAWASAHALSAAEVAACPDCSLNPPDARGADPAWVVISPPENR